MFRWPKIKDRKDLLPHHPDFVSGDQPVLIDSRAWCIVIWLTAENSWKLADAE